jgi:aldehyde dehydrogenase (NAD+)
MFADVLARLGIRDANSGVYSRCWIAKPSAGEIVAFNPATEKPIAVVRTAGREDYDRCVDQAGESFRRWRDTPAPQRGELIRRIGETLRKHKRDLGLLVTLESGKIRSEGEGEVQ